MILRVLLVLVVMGWTATTLLDFLDKYATHRREHTQHSVLAESPLCTQSGLRLATTDVNNCDRAERYAKGEMLSPTGAAFLEIVSDFAICGRGGARCERVATVFVASSFPVAVTVVVLAAACLVLLQKRRIEDAMRRELPLSSSAYPAVRPFYISKEE
jgi:hypothetical protein